jgi:predicted molibdopterin-dependent oxidoreductase YjgC
VQPGVVYTTFHFPESGANVITTENSDWATNCPEYKVTAVQVCALARWRRSVGADRHGSRAGGEIQSRLVRFPARRPLRCVGYTEPQPSREVLA